MFSFVKNTFYHVRSIVTGAFSSKTAAFYVSEGNTLNDCGPNCAAMAARYATGNLSYSGKAMRALYPKPSWWNVSIIKKALQQKGVPFKTGNPSVIRNQSFAAIFHVRGNHFVFAVIQGELVHVYDPFTSPYTASRKSFLSTVTYGQYISVNPAKYWKL